MGRCKPRGTALEKFYWLLVAPTFSIGTSSVIGLTALFPAYEGTVALGADDEQGGIVGADGEGFDVPHG